MQSLWIVEAEETDLHASAGSQVRGDGGDVAAGALNAAGREQVSE
jgi:hypothetical protein